MYFLLIHDLGALFSCKPLSKCIIALSAITGCTPSFMWFQGVLYNAATLLCERGQWLNLTKDKRNESKRKKSTDIIYKYLSKRNMIVKLEAHTLDNWKLLNLGGSAHSCFRWCGAAAAVTGPKNGLIFFFFICHCQIRTLCST